MSKLTTTQRDELVARATAGEKRLALAAEYGLNPTTIRLLLRRRGIKRAEHQRQLDWQRIAALNAQGLHQAAIAREVGCSTKAVTYALRQQQLKPNYSQRWRASRFGGG